MASLHDNLPSLAPSLPSNGRRLAVKFGLSVVVVGLVIWNWLLASANVSALAATDFGKFYYSAKAFLDGHNMYGPTVATMSVMENGVVHNHWNLNPPHFQLIVLPFAGLPLDLALIAWQALGLLALLVALILVLRELGVRLTADRVLLITIAVLAFSAIQVTISTGQVSFLLLMLVTLGWAGMRHGRWVKAGVWLGIAISIKPFMLVFIPYLLLKRRFKALAAAIGSAAICFLIGALVFGPDSYLSWSQVLGAPDWMWDGRNASILGALTRLFDASPHYSPLALAPVLVQPLWLVAAGAVGIITLAASLVGSGMRSVDRAFSLLLLGAQLVSPLGWIYYAVLLIGPCSAVVLAWWRELRQTSYTGAVGPSRLTWWLLGAAVFCLVWPFVATTVFQPRVVATITVGSVYFWGTLLLWVAMVIEATRHAIIRRSKASTLTRTVKPL